jgi:23S rRNA-/tRNA-specific pseudouridylate synthase
MPSKNTKDFVSNTLVQALQRINEFSNVIIQDQDCQPKAKKQKVEEIPNKYHQMTKMSRELS